MLRFLQAEDRQSLSEHTNDTFVIICEEEIRARQFESAISSAGRKERSDAMSDAEISRTVDHLRNSLHLQYPSLGASSSQIPAVGQPCSLMPLSEESSVSSEKGHFQAEIKNDQLEQGLFNIHSCFNRSIPYQIRKDPFKMF